MTYSITTTDKERKFDFKVFVSFNFKDSICEEWVNQDSADFFTAVTKYEILETKPNRFKSQGNKLLVRFTRSTPTIRTFYNIKAAERFAKTLTK